MEEEIIEEKPKKKKKGRPRLTPRKRGRKPLPEEERKRRATERYEKKLAQKKEERARNSTRRFTVHRDPGKAPIRASKFELTPHGREHRNMLDSSKDMWFIMREVAKGRTYADIAEWLTELNGYKVQAGGVYTAVRRAMLEWKRDNLKNIDGFIACELGKLEELEAKVLADYERSRVPKPQEYAALLKQGMTLEEIDAWYEKKGGYAGDPTYLDKLLSLQQRRMKMLGIDAGNDVPQTTIVNYGFDIKDLGELSAIVGNMQDRKHDDLYEEANVIDEEELNAGVDSDTEETEENYG